MLILHKPTNRKGLATDIVNKQTVSVTFDNGDVENVLISEIKLDKKKMKKLKEEEEKTFTTDLKTAQKLVKDKLPVTYSPDGEINEQDAFEYTEDELKAVAREVGKALALALEEIGDEVVSAKITSVESDPQGGSFEIPVVYKEGKQDQFSFYIEGKNLHLSDFTFDKVIGEVGVLPSGEPVVQKDILKDNLVKHFRSLYLEGKAKKDHDGDGEVESSEDEYKGVKDKAIKKAMKESRLAKTKDGQDIFVGDTLYIKGKKFNVVENIKSKSVELVFENSGKTIKPKDPAFKLLLENSVKEDNQYLQNVDLVSVGHVDDEPDMLKKYVYDTAVYAAKLYKMLCEYDNMNAHVDFPNWWQSTIIKARENMSKAQHYLEFENHEEPIDALVGSMIKEKK